MDLNTIINEDCLTAFSKMEEDSVDYVFTSPPYNRKRNDKYTFYDDTKVDYKKFISETIKESLRVSKEYVFFNIMKNYYNKKEVFELIGEFSDQIVDIIIWNKSNPMPTKGNQITNSYEFIIILSKTHSSIKSNRTYTKNVITTNVYSKNPYKKIHRAVMNPDVARSVFADYMLPEKTVLDPFMGVGTTAVVAKEYGLNYLGFEITQEYIDVCNERLEIPNEAI